MSRPMFMPASVDRDTFMHLCINGIKDLHKHPFIKSDDCTLSTLYKEVCLLPKVAENLRICQLHRNPLLKSTNHAKVYWFPVLLPRLTYNFSLTFSTDLVRRSISLSDNFLAEFGMVPKSSRSPIAGKARSKQHHKTS